MSSYLQEEANRKETRKYNPYNHRDILLSRVQGGISGVLQVRYDNRYDVENLIFRKK
jgi:hypothetical protein